MNSKLIPTVSALALLVSSAAFAQQPPAKTEPPTAPPMAKPESPTPAQPPASSQMAPAPQGSRAADAAYIPIQKSGETLARELDGVAVKNAEGESLGSVKDIAIDGQGKIAAVVIGVGGFLGIGEKAVAVPFESIKLTTDKDGKQIATLAATKAALEAAPRYVTVKAQKADGEAQAKKDRASQPQRGTEPPPMPGGVKK